jgi:hypothetical protein
MVRVDSPLKGSSFFVTENWQRAQLLRHNQLLSEARFIYISFFQKYMKWIHNEVLSLHGGEKIYIQWFLKVFNLLWP